MMTALVPYVLLWSAMYYSLRASYMLTLLLGIFAAGFLVRIFVIQHDCGHGSFLASSKANNLLGALCGVLTFTPYQQRRHSHSIHHASSGNLLYRTPDDFPVTLTVNEYVALPSRKQRLYRFYRHPVVQFGLVPLVAILYSQRFSLASDGPRERASTWRTNLTLLAILGFLFYWLGFRAVLWIQVPITIAGSTVGVWLVYIQHQFEAAYWEPDTAWDFRQAGLKGSSYYRLPSLLQWFTGNIGLHHIHHLNPRIPNYSLQRCHDENPIFHPETTLTLRSSLRCAWLSLWDEETKKLVSFAALGS
jgi:omega-6 fatty acid desaturase (delta-12 desaturase)